MTLRQAVQKVQPLDLKSMEAARRRFSQIAIPLGSLGLLEDAVIRLAGILHTPAPQISKRAVVAFCADNGVVAQGVTQCGQEITATVTENMGRGKSTVCLMAEHIGMDVFPVDIGVARDVEGKNIIRRKVRYGTADIACEAAMAREEAIRAIETGIEMAESRVNEGYSLLCAGEMGIGNTTTSAAVTAALLGVPAEDVAGRGAGLSSEGLGKKVTAVKNALKLHSPDPNDAVGVISKVGGLDIAGMAGLYIGGAAYGVPVVLDGVISCAAALLAARLCPLAREYMIASHESDEPASKLLLRELGLKPFINAGMRLGEGTGGVAAVALLDLALSAYLKMASFDEMGIDAYQPLT